MNSFNHYSYGSVADWVYECAAGIRLPEDAPGFGRVLIEPNPDSRMGWLDAEIMTRHGKVRSAWICDGERTRYEITVDMPAHISIGDREQDVEPGTYTFWD